MENLCMGENFSEELACAVCLDSWKDPIELAPCGHIFCRECATALKDCPVCRKPIQSVRSPNRTLVNMALQIRVKCMRCGWKGTREQGMHHKCGDGPAPSSVSPSQPPPPPMVANVKSLPPNPGPSQQSYQGYPPLPPQQHQQPQYQQPMFPNPSNVWQSGRPAQCPPPPLAGMGVGGSSSGGSGYPGGYSPAYQGCSMGGPPSHPAPPPPPFPNSAGGAYPAPQQSSQPPRPKPPPPPQQQQRQRPAVIEPLGPRPWTLYGLDQPEYDQIVSLFVFFDADDSGSLNRNEVARLARWLNFATTPGDVQRIFNDMDADHSGSLSLGEFLTWLRYNKPDPHALYGLTQSQYNTIMMQFHTYDTNQDGCLEMNEFVRLVLHLRDVPHEEMARRLFHMIDRDRDGAINLHEFLTFRAGKA